MVNLRILQYNCRTIQANYNQLANLLYQLNIHVLLVQEWSSQQILTTPTLIRPTFNHYTWYDNNSNRSGILIHNSIPAQQIHIPTPPNIQISDTSEQTVWIQIFGNNHTPSLILCSIYINPHSTTSLQLLSHQFLKAKEISPRILIGGDFNSKHRLWGSPESSSGFTQAYTRGEYVVDFITNNHLFILNNGTPTYLHFNGTRSHIDLTLTTSNLYQSITKWHVQHEHNIGTDHDPIFIHINFQTTLYNDKPRTTWNFKADWQTYQQQLQLYLTNWSQQLTSTQTIDHIYEQFTNAIHTAMRNSMGTTTTKYRPKPWWNKQLQKYVCIARKHYRKWRKTKNPLDRIIWQQSNAIKRKAIYHAKKEHANQQSKLLNTASSKTFWKLWKNTTSKSTSNYLPILNYNGNVITDTTTKLEILNDNFIKPPQPPPQQDYQFYQQIDNFLTNINIHQNQSSFDQTALNKPITIYEIKQCIKLLPTNKAMGPDNIHNQMLINGGQILYKALEQLFNISLNRGELPTQWKMANICPIPKPGRDSTKPTNYRPISLLSCVGKLMERILSHRISHYLSTNHLITNHQHGFQKSKRATDLLTYFVEDIYKSFDYKSATYATFLDISKAYDSVWRDGLIYKLYNQFHIRGKILQWLINFLRNRWCRVQSNGIYSTWKQPKVGVPQGAVLSPTLFIIYINDIPSQFTNTTHIGMFADDIALWTPPNIRKSLPRLVSNLQQDLNTIFQWSSKWKLLFNPTKCSTIIFTKSPTIFKPTFTINNISIPSTTSTKYLGIWFDTKLSWKEHISKIKHKALQRIIQISQLTGINWGITYKTIIHLYKTLVLPILDYGCFLWHTSRYASQLNTIQNRAARLATGSFFTTSIESNNILTSLLPLDIRRIKYSMQNLARAMRTPSSNHLHTSWNSWIKYHPPNQDWTHKYNYSINSPLTQAFKYSKELNLPDIRCHPRIEPTIWEPAYFNTIQKPLFNTNHLTIFTDGSCHPNPGKGSIGVYSPGTDIIPTFHISKLINNRTTINICELHAILIALQHIQHKKYYLQTTHIFIYSDSKFCVDLCNNKFQPKQWIYADLSHKISSLINNIQPTTLSITKIKAHSNIYGNEMADYFANLPHHKYPTQYIPMNKFVPFLTAKTEIESAIYKLWQQRWTHSSTTGRSFWKHQPLISSSIDPLLSKLTKSDCSIITRLRTTHIPLNHHLQKYLNKTNGCCINCSTPETIHHFLFQCPLYHSQRQSMFNYIKRIDPSFSPNSIQIHQLLYPYHLSTNNQIKILQTISFYCKQTDRFIPPYWFSNQ